MVARVQGCYRVVAWMLEQVISVASWTEPSAPALDPGLGLIGDSEECDVGLLPWGSTPCGGSMLLASSSAASISSCAGHASGAAGRLLRQITLICRGGSGTVTVFHARVVFLRLLCTRDGERL